MDRTEDLGEDRITNNVLRDDFDQAMDKPRHSRPKRGLRDGRQLKRNLVFEAHSNPRAAWMVPSDQDRYCRGGTCTLPPSLAPRTPGCLSCVFMPRYDCADLENVFHFLRQVVSRQKCHCPLTGGRGDQLDLVTRRSELVGADLYPTRASWTSLVRQAWLRCAEGRDVP